MIDIFWKMQPINVFLKIIFKTSVYLFAYLFHISKTFLERSLLLLPQARVPQLGCSGDRQGTNDTRQLRADAAILHVILRAKVLSKLEGGNPCPPAENNQRQEPLGAAAEKTLALLACF